MHYALSWRDLHSRSGIPFAHQRTVTFFHGVLATLVVFSVLITVAQL